MGKIALEGVQKNFGNVAVINNVNLTVEDPNTFYQPWQTVQRYTKTPNRPMLEQNCSENNANVFNEPGFVGSPMANKPDF